MDKRVSGLWGKISGAKEEIRSLEEEVRKGKTSLGSKVEDFCFCIGLDSSNSWKPYVDLDEQIKRSEGKEILVVRAEIEACSDMVRMCGVGPPIVNYRVNRKCGYGVLSGKRLNFDLKERVIIFPVDNHWAEILAESSYRIEPDFSMASVERKVGRINMPAWELLHLYDSNSLDKIAGNSSEILVGAEVGDYFMRASGGEGCWGKAKEVLKE